MSKETKFMNHFQNLYFIIIYNLWLAPFSGTYLFFITTAIWLTLCPLHFMGCRCTFRTSLHFRCFRHFSMRLIRKQRNSVEKSLPLQNHCKWFLHLVSYQVTSLKRKNGSKKDIDNQNCNEIPWTTCKNLTEYFKMVALYQKQCNTMDVLRKANLQQGLPVRCIVPELLCVVVPHLPYTCVVKRKQGNIHITAVMHER